MVNYEKSLIYFGANIHKSERALVSNHLRVRVTTNSESYLGFPMIVGRNKRRVCDSYLEKIRRRLESWNVLSMEAKEVIIKTVL